jgi:hypothetical protein
MSLASDTLIIKNLLASFFSSITSNERAQAVIDGFFPGAFNGMIQSKSLVLTAPASVAAGQGTGADTDDTPRVYNLGTACPAGASLVGAVIHLVTPFQNPNTDSLSLEVGGTDADGIISAFDLLGTAGYYDGTPGAQYAEGAMVAAVAGQQLTATLNPGATGKVSENTVGQVRVTVYYLDSTDA